ncbi:MAG: solute-binding protein [Chloroflexi bacterium]|nr:solute-binding protein [Chloroflexota bacterium]
MLSRHIAFLFILLLLPLLGACANSIIPDSAPAAGTKDTLVLATTTSTYDSGLLDAIIPDFEAKTGIQVHVIAVGTGQALALGRAGDADVLLVHARQLEDQFVADGFAPTRFDVMYNDFVIVGPTADPAKIKGMTDAAQALAQIAASQAPFISRGDSSGTYVKEQKIWQIAGIEPAGDWYQSVGQGMGAVLNMADEQQAYTLSDRGTYLSRTSAGINLDILVEGDPILRNPYGVLPVTPNKDNDINYDAAVAFINWITSPEVQTMIGEFGVEKFGKPLFYPDAKPQ